MRIFISPFLISWFALPLALAAPAKPFKVVIDPGHGGSDHGAIVKMGDREITEKDLTLLLALETEKSLKKKGYTVFLTRSQDREIPLSLRTALANRLKADLFISLHMNSHRAAKPGDARGMETYFLNTTSDEMSRRLAYLENTPNRPNLPSVENGGGETEGHEDIALILKDLTLGANLNESKRLACLLQKNLVSATSANQPPARRAAINRGVKQALFHVLLGADMPSALVEAGFMNHPGDRSQVIQPQGRAQMANGIAQAVEQFRAQRNTRLAAIELSSCTVR